MNNNELTPAAMADVLASPVEMLILWAIYERLCSNFEDFLVHFELDELQVRELIESLSERGFLRNGLTGLILDATGVAAIYQLQQKPAARPFNLSIYYFSEILSYSVSGNFNINIHIDNELANSAHCDIIYSNNMFDKLSYGNILHELLIPPTLSDQLFGGSPVVLQLDQHTARFPWEMLAWNRAGHTPMEFEGHSEGDLFLGLAQGVTRQLCVCGATRAERTAPGRILRVLVVADTDEDDPMPEASREGIEVAELFRAFNGAIGQSRSDRGDHDSFPPIQIEVVSMIGPLEADPVAVMGRILMSGFDVVHYSGGCVYDAEHPARSGWKFSRGFRMSAKESMRTNHIPQFVFSNACESRSSHDRSQLRSAQLCPGFAAEFLMAGVDNFICPAWSVDPSAARQFALSLYGNLLGITPQDHSQPGASESKFIANNQPETLSEAMRQACALIARAEGGVQAWGAYQHYGSPHFRLISRINQLNLVATLGGLEFMG